MTRYKVVLVDDHPLIRDGLRRLINEQTDMQVVGEAEDGAQALKIVRELKPCSVVLDIALPDFNGLEIAAQIRRFSKSINQNINVIILSMFIKESIVYQALQCGAKGYVVKTTSSSEIINAIRHVCQGMYYISPEISSNIILGFMKGHESNQPRNPYNLLTEREQQIYRLLAEGHSNKDISVFLNISSKTVERHRANIMSKLDIHSYHALLKYAIEVGILED